MDETKRVLIIDDDKHISELLRLYFEKDGFEVTAGYSGDAVLPLVRAVNPDVMILDLMLPGMSGFDVMRELRRESDVPVLMLTARSDTLDKIVGLELGADDYILKPFEPKELLARVKAVLRRSRSVPSVVRAEEHAKDKDNVVSYPGLVVDRIRYTVRIGDQEIDMPPKELELLFFLATHPNRVFTRDQILENIWGMDYYGEQRTVDVHIKRIREKLDVIDHPLWQIKTVWSVGYKFEVKDDEIS
ncbi:MAG TPA: response regulator transcription factor [Clostridiaceae bacterium]|jgi:DNA-binding response OmpR family regulator|nr:response regulator transcription factor [Clostridiaceae bacterium]